MLDVGCGNGEIEEIICQDFNKIVGIDCAQERLLKKATRRKLNNCKFLSAHAQRLCFANCVFDVVILINFLHHNFHSIHNTILESYRVLKKGGLMIIFELNPFNPLQLIWFYLLCPIDKDMRMINPIALKRVLNELTDDDTGKIIIKPLLSSLFFE